LDSGIPKKGGLHGRGEENGKPGKKLFGRPRVWSTVERSKIPLFSLQFSGEVVPENLFVNGVEKQCCGSERGSEGAKNALGRDWPLIFRNKGEPGGEGTGKYLEGHFLYTRSSPKSPKERSFLGFHAYDAQRQS